MTIPIQNQPALATTARRYALLSVGAAVVTIALKSTAYGLTGSVGLLSDAIESVVNLVAALVAVWALTLTGRPADREHAYGHTQSGIYRAPNPRPLAQYNCLYPFGAGGRSSLLGGSTVGPRRNP